MPDYRVYCLDGAGKISLANLVKASSDAEAIARARAREMHRGGLKCEVWQLGRLVATLDASDLAA